MKRKVLASLLCATMVATMFAGCGSKEEEPVAENTEAEPATEEEAASAEELPAEFAHITFDQGADEGYKALTQTEDVGDNDGATYGLAETEADFTYASGAVGDCLYLDGSYGLDLGLEATNTDAYTVSFWVDADRLADYGPTLQVGYNIGKAADADNDVTWMNVTQTNWSDKYFPTIWSRNEASDAEDGTDCWPWEAQFQDGGSIVGKGEWAMITIVCSGEEQAGPTGATTAGSQLYINGELVYDSQDNYENGTYFEYTWDATIAPNIMQPGDYTFESYFGINYWDTIFKGYIDDLYVYDSALTAGQVLTLYGLGDATNVPAAAEEETTDSADASAIEAVGTTVGDPSLEVGFWTAFSDTWQVAEGESVTKTFTNYTDGANNWDNFVCILQNVADVHSADDNADYKEYAVVRADNYGWCGADNTVDNADTLGWTVESDWNWDTFATDMNGAQVELTVTNNGSTADIVAVVTTSDGATHNQSYTGIPVDGDLYFCLSCENAFLNDIQ